MPVLFQLSKSKLFFDEVYEFYLKKIQYPFFRFIEVMELLFISGLMVRGVQELLEFLPFGEIFLFWQNS